MPQFFARLNLSPPSAVRYALYALVALGHALRAWQIWQYPPSSHLFSDPLRHWTHASEVLDTGPMAFFDPVGYQLWLSMVQRLSYGEPLLISIYVIALSSLTPWVWYRLLRALRIGPLMALSGWVIYAWLPSWLAIYSYFMTETLFLPMLGWSLWMTVRADTDGSCRSLAWAIGVWTATALVRGIAAPMAAVCLLPVWWRWPGKPKKLLLGLLVAAFIALPLAYRNHQNVGIWSPFGNPWLNQIYAASGKSTIHIHLVKDGAYWVYGYGSPSIGEKPFYPLSDWSSRRVGEANIAADLRKGDSDWRAAFAQTKASDNAWIYAENLIYLLFGSSWPDNNVEQAFARWQNHLRWLWAPLCMAVLLASLRQWRSCWHQPMLITALLAYVLFHGFTLLAVNEGRYRKPLEGLLIAQALLLFAQRQHQASPMRPVSEHPPV